jgi:thymidine kinase
MFIEPHIGRNGREEKNGWIEVISGCMFSGKTEELIRRLNRALIAKQKVEIFKPTVDKRYDDEKIVSHSEREIRSTPVNFAGDILLLTGDCDVVGIDEAQFFDDAIVDVCNTLASRARYGLYRQAFWADAELIGRGRICNESPCHLCPNR